MVFLCLSVFFVLFFDFVLCFCVTFCVYISVFCVCFGVSCLVVFKKLHCSMLLMRLFFYFLRCVAIPGFDVFNNG